MSGTEVSALLFQSQLASVKDTSGGLKKDGKQEDSFFIIRPTPLGRFLHIGSNSALQMTSFVPGVQDPLHMPLLMFTRFSIQEASYKPLNTV